MNTTLSFPIKGQTILNQAKDLVPGFAAAFQKFQQHIVLQQNSLVALQLQPQSRFPCHPFPGKIPHLISIDELNAYPTTLPSLKDSVSAISNKLLSDSKYWFRVFDMEAHALKNAYD
ncbi:MAG: hypothetical protein IPN09_08985 [Bacteroidetes bacterium]|nr:hypothetical protein [Bacteroidota bacterium]